MFMRIVPIVGITAAADAADSSFHAGPARAFTLTLASQSAPRLLAGSLAKRETPSPALSIGSQPSTRLTTDKTQFFVTMINRRPYSSKTFKSLAAFNYCVYSFN